MSSLKASPATAGGTAASPVLPPIREDLRLYPGAPARDGSPSWRILDPIRNSFFEIGWLEFELLARWSEHRDFDSLVERVGAETQLKPTAEEVQHLVEFLAHNQLLAPGSEYRRMLVRAVPVLDETGRILQLPALGEHRLFEDQGGERFPIITRFPIQQLADQGMSGVEFQGRRVGRNLLAGLLQ